MPYIDEEQPSEVVPSRKIDFFIQSINYVNSLSLPTRSEAEEHNIFDEDYDEEVEKVCNELLSQAIQWDVKAEKITKNNFYGVKGKILKRIKENIKELEEVSEEVDIFKGGLPPKVGGKK